jgi:outer membrane protein TolC
MYYTILAENELLEAQRQDYNDLQKTADIISEGNTLLGVTSPTDVAQAEAAALASQGQYLNLQEVIGQENKQMLSVMNLTDPHTELVYGDDEAAPSSAEGQDVQAVINQAIKVAPEKVQIDYLVAAAKEGKWTQTFSYLGGNSTLSTSSGSNGTGSTGFSSSSLSSLYLHDTLNLGFGIFPTIQLGNDNIAVTELRQTELVNEEQLTISSAMLSLASALQQYELANKATVDAQKVYNDKNNAYQMGFATLLDVLSARTALTQAEMTSVKAKLDLNLQRLTMHRSLLDDQFALIPPCKMTAPPKKDLGALWDWIKGVFVGEQPSNSNIDKDCRPDPAPSAAPVPA